MVVKQLIKKHLFPKINSVIKLPSVNFEQESLPAGLVPAGDTGLYHNLGLPADPTNCELYPDSPYCGGNPFSLDLFSLYPEISFGRCDLRIKLEGSLAFIKMPPKYILYRYPRCREEKAPTSPEKNSTNTTQRFYPIDPKTFPTKPGCLYKVTVQCTATYFYYLQDGTSNIYYAERQHEGKVIVWGKVYGVGIDRYHSVSRDHPFYGTGYHGSYIEDYTVYSGGAIDIFISENYGLDPEYYRRLRAQNYLLTDSRFYDNWNTLGQYTYPNYDTSIEHHFLNNHNRYNYLVNCQRYRLNDSPIGTAKTPLAAPRNFFGRNIVSFDLKIIKIEELKCCSIPRTNKYNPPPPIDKPKEENMACCPQHTALLYELIEKIDELSEKVEQEAEEPTSLEAITEKIDKLSEIIGVDEFPASLPQSLISKDEGFIGNLIPNPNKEIANLTQFLAWYVERFDEIMGQWEVPIEIKDSDPSTPGDQPKGVKLPNMAEAIAEMFVLSFQSYANSETLLNLATRNLVETGTDKQQNFITYKLLQSLTDWVGFKQKDIKLDMPLSFSPGKTRFDELIQETTIQVPCVEFDDKFGLEVDLMRFREAAGILQAVYKRKLDPKGDIKGQILDYLLKTYAAMNKINDDGESFQEFINRVETGFTDIPTVGDATKPYGRPFNQRPKVRDLSDIDEQT